MRGVTMGKVLKPLSFSGPHLVTTMFTLRTLPVAHVENPPSFQARAATPIITPASRLQLTVCCQGRFLGWPTWRLTPGRRRSQPDLPRGPVPERYARTGTVTPHPRPARPTTERPRSDRSTLHRGEP